MKRVFAAVAALMLSLQLAVMAFADAAAPNDPKQMLSGATPGAVILIAAVVLLAAVCILLAHRKKKKAAQAKEEETDFGGDTE
ncbi:MAG: hypothetical protein IJK64_00845 [Clostridia bacterium]|nr:hypothetical protein [Clostridia bacterium]